MPEAEGLMELQRVLYARRHFRARNSRNETRTKVRGGGRDDARAEFHAPPRNVFA